MAYAVGSSIAWSVAATLTAVVFAGKSWGLAAVTALAGQLALASTAYYVARIGFAAAILAAWSTGYPPTPVLKPWEAWALAFISPLSMPAIIASVADSVRAACLQIAEANPRVDLKSCTLELGKALYVASLIPFVQAVSIAATVRRLAGSLEALCRVLGNKHCPGNGVDVVVWLNPYNATFNDKS